MQDEIFIAAQKGDTLSLRRFLYDKPQLVGAYSPEGWTPLHLAAHFGHLETAKELVTEGAEVNSVSKNEMANNPLHAAVAGNHTIMVAFLIDSGADVNNKQHGGWTPLHGAVQNGNLGMVRLLVDNGADINLTSDDGMSAISLALDKKFSHIAEYLISKGARQTTDIK
jgi:uncharacterized protein